MKCKEFKRLVVDLFDREVDSNIRMECERHMASCASCREYHDKLNEAVGFLTPRKEVVKSRERKGKPGMAFRKIWKVAAAVLIFVSGVAVGWTHLFSSDAIAGNSMPTGYLSSGVKCVRNVGSYRMTLYVRTTPNENFHNLSLADGFVRMDISFLRQDGIDFFRVEKDGGRTVVCDGAYMYMWANGSGMYLRGSLESGFLEKFDRLVFPEKLLAMQETAINGSAGNKVTQSEDSTMVTITTEFAEKNMDMRQLFEKRLLDEQKVIVENTFSKSDGLLRSMRIYIGVKDEQHLAVYSSSMEYNVMLSKQDIVALPDQAEWLPASLSGNVAQSRLSLLQAESPVAAAKRIVNALISHDISKAEEALYYYRSSFDDVCMRFADCTATDFTERTDSSYPGVWVYFKLTERDGKQKTSFIALRKDDSQRVWYVDGGL